MIGVKFEDDLVVKVMEAAVIPTGWTTVIVANDASSLGTDEIAVAVPVTFEQATAAMRSGDWLVPRPQSPIPYVDGGTVTVPPVPLNTHVKVTYLTTDLVDTLWEYTADVDGWTETFGFVDAGDYEISVTPPIPYQPSKIRIQFP